jgi:hypothetical protein
MSAIVEAHTDRHPATLVAVGDRVTGAVGAVEIEQGDWPALAEEVAPP